jgi:hypothetical protein
MELNCDGSKTWSDLAGRFQLDEGAIFSVLRELFDHAAYARAIRLLTERWKEVLRDPCTRTNSVLVRPGHLSHFLDEEFR